MKIMYNIEKIIIKKIENMREEIVEFIQEMVKIPSEVPPGKYREISKFVAAKMQNFGIKTKIKRNNVIGEIGNENGPTLIFNAHLDTVASYNGWIKDPHGGEIIENKIFGRGTSDDKSCVAAEIFATKALMDAGVDLNGKLLITAVINEEIGGLLGAEYLVNEGIVKGDACLLGDVSYDYPFIHLGGTFQISFIIKGTRRHAQAFPDLPPPNRNKFSGINAIAKMVPIMNFLLELQNELIKSETKYSIAPSFPSKTNSISFTMIEGGVSVTTIPNKCVLQCIISTIPEQDLESIKIRILDFIDELKKKDPDLDIKVQIPINLEPYIANINSRFAKIIKEVFKSVYNEEREFKAFIPTTDAQHFRQKGIETILIGPIRAESNIHSTDEFVYIEDVINVTKLYALTALNYLK